jgi:hypothetical protein
MIPDAHDPPDYPGEDPYGSVELNVFTSRLDSETRSLLDQTWMEATALYRALWDPDSAGPDKETEDSIVRHLGGLGPRLRAAEGHLEVEGASARKLARTCFVLGQEIKKAKPLANATSRKCSTISELLVAFNELAEAFLA